MQKTEEKEILDLLHSHQQLVNNLEILPLNLIIKDLLSENFGLKNFETELNHHDNLHLIETRKLLSDSVFVQSLTTEDLKVCISIDDINVKSFLNIIYGTKSDQFFDNKKCSDLQKFFISDLLETLSEKCFNADFSYFRDNNFASVVVSNSHFRAIFHILKIDS